MHDFAQIEEKKPFFLAYRGVVFSANYRSQCAAVLFVSADHIIIIAQKIFNCEEDFIALMRSLYVQHKKVLWSTPLSELLNFYSISSLFPMQNAHEALAFERQCE